MDVRPNSCGGNAAYRPDVISVAPSVPRSTTLYDPSERKMLCSRSCTRCLSVSSHGLLWAGRTVQTRWVKGLLPAAPARTAPTGFASHGQGDQQACAELAARSCLTETVETCAVVLLAQTAPAVGLAPEIPKPEHCLTRCCPGLSADHVEPEPPSHVGCRL